MRRRIENPRILLLDCPLEYKKGESQTNVEIMNEVRTNVCMYVCTVCNDIYVNFICAYICNIYGSTYFLNLL